MDKQWIIIAVIFASALTLHFINDSRDDKPEGTVETQDEWCEVGQVMSDGSIIYHGDPGTTELIAVATSDGPKLMGKCK